MFSVTVDLSSLEAQEEEAVRSLEHEQPSEMKRILDAAAAEERSTHEYTNRTHRLEDSTKAGDLVQDQNGFSVEYGAGMEYASFVANRGLSRVEELAGEAETEIEYYFDGEAQRLGSL